MASICRHERIPSPQILMETHVLRGLGMLPTQIQLVLDDGNLLVVLHLFELHTDCDLRRDRPRQPVRHLQELEEGDDGFGRHLVELGAAPGDVLRKIHAIDAVGLAVDDPRDAAADVGDPVGCGGGPRRSRIVL